MEGRHWCALPNCIDLIKCGLVPLVQQIKKKLKSLDLKPVKIKMPTKSYCFVNFRSDEDRANLTCGEMYTLSQL